MNIMQRYALRSLKKNKTRTVVTIIGVILSAAMVSAVMVFTSSLLAQMEQSVISSVGDWHGMAEDVDETTYEAAIEDDDVENFASFRNEGFVELENPNMGRPFAHIMGMSDGAENVIPIQIKEGRMPNDGSEIVIPSIMNIVDEGYFAIGNEVTLNVGTRYSGGMLTRTNSVKYYGDNDEYDEEVRDTSPRTFTIVGIYSDTGISDYGYAGYSCFTREDDSITLADSSYNVYLHFSDIQIAKTKTAELFEGNTVTLNNDYLRLHNASGEGEFSTVYLTVLSLLVILIAVSSVSLIYNAFSISASERTKDFGLLKSIGATNRQVRRSIFFEAFAVCLVGIPLGLVAGVLGIGVTLKVLANDLSSLFYTSMSGDSFDVVVTPSALLVAALIALITVMISAIIPAIRVTRMTVIDALRQAKDIKIKSKDVHTSKLAKTLFGFPGMIGAKYFKRNKKKYRTTVVSLFVSIVLFISVTSLLDYVNTATSELLTPPKYDIWYSFYSTTKEEKTEEDRLNLYKELSEVSGITGHIYTKTTTKIVPINEDMLTEIGAGAFVNTNEIFSEDCIYVLVCYYEDDAFVRYCNENDIDPEKYLEDGSNTGLLMDSFQYVSSNSNQRATTYIFDEVPETLSFRTEKTIEGYQLTGRAWSDEEQTTCMQYTSLTDPNDIISIPAAEAMTDVRTLHIGERITTPPIGMEEYFGSVPTIIMPLSQRENNQGVILEDNVKTYFTYEEGANIKDEMQKIILRHGFNTSMLNDVTMAASVDRSAVLVLRVFTYGFIALISMIAAANVFNTISTNIRLRRREFAVLRSIGMTRKDMRRMMNYECLLYGIKSISLGVPVSILISIWIYVSMNDLILVGYILPWKGIVIAVLTVFVVVFSTMLYSINKINKENTIESLRAI